MASAADHKGAAAAAGAGDGKVKEDLSRMEGAYGAQLIGKLKKMCVLIVGLRGLGIETAKNLILAGPHTVVVHDDEKCRIEDLGANFYLLEEDTKRVADEKDEKTKKVTKKGRPERTRAEASMRQLSTLNPNVLVSAHSGAITNEYLLNFHVVVYADHTPLKDLLQTNAFCRAHGIKFIAAHLAGVTASVFVDFGNTHSCFDADGALEIDIIVDGITNEKNGVVTIDGDRHLLHDGELVKLEGVNGMKAKDANTAAKAAAERRDEAHRHPEKQQFVKTSDTIYNITDTFEIKCMKGKDANGRDVEVKNKFLIGDTTQLTPYINGGTGTQVKLHRTFSHKSMHDNVLAPRLCAGYTEFMKGHGQATLHLAQLAIWQFRHLNNRLPELHNEADAAKVVELAKAFNNTNNTPGFFLSSEPIVEVKELDAEVIRKVALYARTEISAMAALFGGVVAQEIVKQTGKYTPISQWLHFDALEMLPNAAVAADAKPIGSRYDHQIALFGKAFQDKLARQKVFLVGCGALGCEYLKAIAMTGMGLDVKSGGEVHITDMDRIELSNLSRQFLFRRKHVGKAKSLSAKEAGTEMNPAVEAATRVHEVRVGPDTEDVFTDQYWKKLDIVLNALDNMIARQYTDGQCVLHERPLFESGTLGTQANSVIVLPHKTSSYSEGAAAGEGKGIAKCTLQNFPALPLHCIEWAREMFDENFIDGAQKCLDFLSNPQVWIQKNADGDEQLDGLRAVKLWLDLIPGASVERCVKLAFDDFNRRYRDKIIDLTTAFPADARNIDSATKADLGPFWHGHKRFPRVAEFDAKNPEHVQYVFHGAALYAFIFGLYERTEDIPKVLTLQSVTAIVSKLKAEPYKKGNVSLDEGKKKKNDDEQISQDDYKEISELTKYLESVDVKKYKKLVPVDFEKDDDTNHHIDWITSATNMRAWNYSIEPSKAATVRLTAGRIIPAIATTTASITGFVMLEVMKYVLTSDFGAYRQATINLAVNTFVCEPLDGPKMRADFKEKVEDDEKSTEFKKVFKDVQWRAYPKPGFSVWDKIVVNKGDITFADLVKEIESRFPEVQVETLFKRNITKKEVDAGLGINLFNKANPFAAQKKRAEDQLPKTTHAALKAALQRDIDNFNNAEKKKDEVVSKRYLGVYGKLATADRNYFMLEGNYVNKAGEKVLLPPILFVFGKGSWVEAAADAKQNK